MEKLVDLGIVKSIGLSNFNSDQVDRVVNESRIKPVSNQIECSPMINQKKLTAFCKERDVVIVAYSPLGQPNASKKVPAFLFSDELKKIADKHDKTSAQIVLRYLVIFAGKFNFFSLFIFNKNNILFLKVELGVVPIPKSVNENRLLENISVYDFELSDEDKEIMDSFNTGQRIVKLSDAKHAKYWPFGLEM